MLEMSNFKQFDWKIQRFFQFSETWTGKRKRKAKELFTREEGMWKKPRKGRSGRWELRNGDSALGEHPIPRDPLQFSSFFSLLLL